MPARRDAKERFEEKFSPEPNSGCWIWTACIHKTGYGMFSWVMRAHPIKAHRAAWVLYRGPIPLGAHVLHRCDNRACVNPDHLFLGDNAANVADKVAKGRTPRGEATAQAKLTAADVVNIAADPRLHREIGAQYGVAPAYVTMIKGGKKWRHIERKIDARGVVRGEASGAATLTNAQVLAIRADNRKQIEIADDFGIHQGTVSKIKRRQVWTHI